MTFEYMWLKILEVLTRANRQMATDEIRSEMARRGFPVSSEELGAGLRTLRGQGLVEALVLAGGETEALASVAVTPRGEKKVRSIIRF